MINLCFYHNNEVRKVLAVEDNSTSIMDQIYLLSTNYQKGKLKIKDSDEKVYTVLANTERTGGKIFYTKTGVENGKFSVGFANARDTIAFKVGGQIYYGISDMFINNYQKFVFVDGENQSNQITKFYTHGQKVDIFLETVPFFDAHPEKGIAYWTVDGDLSNYKYDPIEGYLTSEFPRTYYEEKFIKNSTVVLKSTYKYLNKPLDSVNSYGNMVRNQVTSTSRIRDVITGGGGGGGSTGGGT